MNRAIRSVAVAAAIWLASAAQAATVVWDWSPDATGAAVLTGGLKNEIDSQHFAERVSFASGLTLVGIDIYSIDWWGYVGDPVVVSIYADGNGRPGARLETLVTQISVVDRYGAGGPIPGGLLHRLHADFRGVPVEAGTGYWIGMSGWGSTQVLAGLSGVAGGDGKMAEFRGFENFHAVHGLGDMAFRLYAAAVPEASSAAMAAAGLLLMSGLLARRRHRG